MEPRNTALVKHVRFMNLPITVLRDQDGEVYANIQQIGQNIGLSPNQMQAEIMRIRTNETLQEGFVTFLIQTDIGKENAPCLQVDYVHIWLARITVTKSMRDADAMLAARLKQYQLGLNAILSTAFSERNPIQNMTDEEIAAAILARPKKSVANIARIINARQPDETPAIMSGKTTPIQMFLNEMLPQCRWDILPFGFLYDLYMAWYGPAKTNGIPCGRNTFIGILKSLLDTDDCEALSNWYYDEKQPLHPGHRMNASEPLILKYNLKNWANHGYTKSDPVNYCRTPLKTSYKGLTRKRPDDTNEQEE